MTNDILSGYRLHWLLIFELLFLPCILPQNRRCWWRLPPAIGPELESFTVNINGVHSERWSWSIVRLSRHDDAGISLIPRLCGLQHESGRGWQLRSNYVITHEECGILI